MSAREPIEHELKCWPPFFGFVFDGSKPFEVRRADRDYRVGDTLFLREWSTADGYSGRECRRTVACMLEGPGFGIKAGYVVLGLNPISALSAMPLASRLALARALVPGWAVVPVEPSRQMMECAVVRHYNKGSLAEVWTAMLTAAEEPPHGP